MRAKVIKSYKQYKQGEVVELTPNEFHGLSELGVVIVSKDMTARDYKTLKGKDNGNIT